MDLQHLQDIETQLVQGRLWIVGMEVLVPAAAQAAKLLERGAHDVLVVACSRGTGPVAELPPNRVILMNLQAQGMMEAIRASEVMLDALPPEIVAQVDNFDPHHEARAIRLLVSAGRPIAGRPTWGRRPEAWQALEDKTVIDALWDAAGVPRAPSVVVPVEREALTQASRDLDQGEGVVWAGDNREGFHGGASGTRWISRPEHIDTMLPFFAAHHHTARVMPFLEGLPCSIHGMVFPDFTVALRPNEMIVLRRPGSAEFHYCGFGNFWDPTPQRREEMRALVRRVGALLRERVGYRGAFSMDGVMTAQGFRPTELNPRIGAALYPVFGKSLNLDLLNGAIVEGLDLDWRPQELEALLLEQADGRRGAGGGILVAAPEQPQQASLVFEGGVMRRALEGEPAELELSWGPGPAGGFLRAVHSPEHTPKGPSLAPRVVAMARWAEQEWGLNIGPLEVAPDLR